MSVAAEITLQINLCAGDVAYAHQTVPALVRAHPDVATRLAVVDCCRPQRTRIHDPAARIGAAEFATNVAAIRVIAGQLQRVGFFNRVEFLEPGDSRFTDLARRYVQGWMTATHDYGGCAFMAYWAAIEFPTTRYVLHYDADMLLHNAAGYDWAVDAISHWPVLSQVVAAGPRVSPPGFEHETGIDAPSRHEARPATAVPAGWLNDWFSTRCLLLDRNRLAPYLPLLRGRRAMEMRLRAWLDRGYPPGPEQLLHRHLGDRGLRCLQLRDERAWLLHPTRKDAEFSALLPSLLEHIARGDVPPGQRGYADIRLEEWAAFLTSPAQ